LKNQEPTKHATLTAPTPATEVKPGKVPAAKSADPTANSRHWWLKVTSVARRVLS
jgi:hypothetical protein